MVSGVSIAIEASGSHYQGMNAGSFLFLSWYCLWRWWRPLVSSLPVTLARHPDQTSFVQSLHTEVRGSKLLRRAFINCVRDTLP